MAEALRNEQAITLGGEERTMRATFAALRGIEQSLGESILATLGRARTLGVTDATTVIFFGLKGYDDTRLTLEQVGDMVVQEGLTNVAVPVMKFLGIAMNGVQVGKSEATQS